MAVSREDRERRTGGGGGGAARRPFMQHGKSDGSAIATRYSKEGRMAAKDAIARGEGYQGKKFLAKQKRWEKKGGAGPVPDAASAAARGTGKGFQIGPKPQKGIYTGKADKIKVGLIKNAKIKQAYAKVLKQEKQKSAGRAEDGDADMAESGSSGDEEEHDMQAEPSALSASKRSKGKGRADPDAMREDVETPFEVSTSTSRPALRKRKSSELEHNPENMLDSSDEEEVIPAPGPDHLRGATAPALIAPEPYVHPSRQTGDAETSKGKGKGKMRGRQSAPLPSQKQQLAADGQPKQKRQRLSEDEIQLLREKREADSKAWAKKTEKGQPNLGSRMGVLLGKIERKVGAGSR